MRGRPGAVCIASDEVMAIAQYRTAAGHEQGRQGQSVEKLDPGIPDCVRAGARGKHDISDTIALLYGRIAKARPRPDTEAGATSPDEVTKW